MAESVETSVMTEIDADGWTVETTTTVTKKGNSTSTKTSIRKWKGAAPPDAAGGSAPGGGAALAPAPAPTTLQTSDAFLLDLLEAHNKLRVLHGAKPIELSTEATEAAQKWADHLGESGQLQHGGHDGMGQNLACMGGRELTGAGATQMWYDEIKDYDFQKAQFSPGTGHFTQVVWESCTHVGAGRHVKDGKYIVVANYLPAGNIQGRFAENVKPKV